MGRGGGGGKGREGKGREGNGVVLIMCMQLIPDSLPVSFNDEFCFVSQKKEEVWSSHLSTISNFNDDTWPSSGKLKPVDPRKHCAKTVRELNRSAVRAYVNIELDAPSLSEST